MELQIIQIQIKQLAIKLHDTIFLILETAQLLTFLLGFVYQYGRLNEKVKSIKETLDKLEKNFNEHLIKHE